MRDRSFAGLGLGLALALVTVLLAALAGSPQASTAREREASAPETAVAARAGRPLAPMGLPAPATPTPTATPSARVESGPLKTEGAAQAIVANPVTRSPGHSPSPPPQGQDLPSPTPTPSRPATATPEPAASTPTPEVQTGQLPAPTVIGTSVEGRPLEAFRIGTGQFKVVLVGDIHGEYEDNTHVLALRLLEYYVTHPEEVPPQVSLWIIPTINPDGLATGHRWNAHDVDLNRNADTDLDGCAGNDWSPDTVGLEGRYPGAGGPYPFSEPETRALRDFLADAWIAVFYHSAAGEIYADTCQRHAPSARLAEALAAGSGYPVPAEGWAGYRITGDFADYLAGEGVAAVAVELTDHEEPEFERNLAGVQSMLAAVDDILAAEGPNLLSSAAQATPQPAEAATAVTATWSGSLPPLAFLDETNTGRWQYPAGTFLHPLALEVTGTTAYLLDGGRVLALDLDPAAGPTAPAIILAPGDDVEGVPVLEPLDLAMIRDPGSVNRDSEAAATDPESRVTSTDSLLVLDRAGDVYHYNMAAASWSLERYDRPSGATSSHYYVALASGAEANYLLETSAEQIVRFPPGERGAAWAGLPKGRDVDLAAAGDAVYALARSLSSPQASLLKIRGGRQVASFRPGLGLLGPRQVVATEDAVYVLDRDGRRLLTLDPASGALRALYQFADRREVGAMGAAPPGARGGSSQTAALILAGRDALYFVAQPDRRGESERTASREDEEAAGSLAATGTGSGGWQAYDPALIDRLRGLAMPIDGASLTSRDFQLPGAPRHYRLGVHEGIDFYGYAVGVPVDRSTPVRAVAGGTVIRAALDYQPLTAAQNAAWQAEWQRAGTTPPDVLDGYRGRQVWIDHGDGLVSRYAHLGSIAPGIVVGAQVSQGQVIATVGNSGTPASITSDTVEVHLHLELWVGDHYVGQYLRPIETRVWLERILR